MTTAIALAAACVAAALLWAWGRALLALVDARGDGADVVAATLIGVLALTLAVVAQVATGRQPSLALTAAALGATVVAAGWHRGWRALAVRREATTAHPHEPPWERALAGAIAAAVVAAVLSAAWVARHAPLDWDAVALWTLKARALEAAASFRDHYLTRVGPSTQFHQDYPLAVPSVDWWVARLGGGPVPRAASLAGVAWLAALPALAWSMLRARAGAALATAAGLALVVQPALRFGSYGGMADLPLGVVLLATMRELAREDARGRRRAALLLALAAATKNEGMIFVLAALLAQVVDAARARDWRRAPLILLPVALSLPWPLVLRGSDVTTRGVGDLAATPGLGQLVRVALAERLPVLASGLVQVLLLPTILPAVLLFAGGLAMQAARWRRGSRAPLTPWLAIVLYFGGLLASYLLLVHEPIGWLVETSLQRLVSAMLPSLAVLGVLGLADGQVVEVARPVAAGTPPNAPRSTGPAPAA